MPSDNERRDSNGKKNVRAADGASASTTTATRAPPLSGAQCALLLQLCNEEYKFKWTDIAAAPGRTGEKLWFDGRGEGSLRKQHAGITNNVRNNKSYGEYLEKKYPPQVLQQLFPDYLKIPTTGTKATTNPFTMDDEIRIIHAKILGLSYGDLAKRIKDRHSASSIESHYRCFLKTVDYKAFRIIPDENHLPLYWNDGRREKLVHLIENEKMPFKQMEERSIFRPSAEDLEKYYNEYLRPGDEVHRLWRNVEAWDLSERQDWRKMVEDEWDDVERAIKKAKVAKVPRIKKDASSSSKKNNAPSTPAEKGAKRQQASDPKKRSRSGSPSKSRRSGGAGSHTERD